MIQKLFGTVRSTITTIAALALLSAGVYGATANANLTALIALYPTSLSNGNFKVSVQENSAATAAGTNFMGHVGQGSQTNTLSWTVDTTALAAGDVLSTTDGSITSFFPTSSSVMRIKTLVIHDPDDQGIGFDIFLLNANNSLGTQNSAPNINDANSLTIKCVIPVDAADFYDLGGTRVAQVNPDRQCDIPGGGQTTLYFGGVTRGAPTYAGGTITIDVVADRVGG